jgi:sugar O-acyltransferase (sialic acid O-acetyltransferase NeuD family)
VDFEDVPELYPSRNHDFFVAVGYANKNELRRKRYETARGLGYKMASYISPYAIIHPNAQIGEHCFILETVVIEPFVRIGDNVTIWSGTTIGHYGTIASHCFLSLRATVGGGTHIGEQSVVGLGAIVRDHICIGSRCTIGTAASVLFDIASDTTV